MVVDDLWAAAATAAAQRRGRVSSEERCGDAMVMSHVEDTWEGRRTQRGLALACGFLRLLVADHLSTWHLTTFLQQTTSMGGGGSPALLTPFLHGKSSQ